MRNDSSRTPDELWNDSLLWIARTGWPTRVYDQRIAEHVYTSWIRQTNTQWLRTGERDRDLLASRLKAAFHEVHDGTSADCLVIVFLLLLELRARSEGQSQRNAMH